MTNEEKFIEVFGVKPDTNTFVLECPDDECNYFDSEENHNVNSCHCNDWWKEEYKGDK